MAQAPRQHIAHTLTQRPDKTYDLGIVGLTRAETAEVLLSIRRLELFRLMEVDSDIVETASRQMAQFELSQHASFEPETDEDLRGRER